MSSYCEFAGPFASVQHLTAYQQYCVDSTCATATHGTRDQLVVLQMSIWYSPKEGPSNQVNFDSNWYSRQVLSWPIRNTIKAAFCVNCLEAAARAQQARSIQQRPGNAIYQ